MVKSYHFIVLISVWKKVHAMKCLFIYRRDLVVRYGWLVGWLLIGEPSIRRRMFLLIFLTILNA